MKKWLKSCKYLNAWVSCTLSKGLNLYKYTENEMKHNRGAKQSKAILPIIYENFCTSLQICLLFVHVSTNFFYNRSQIL